jgi:hypothetical protein
MGGPSNNSTSHINQYVAQQYTVQEADTYTHIRAHFQGFTGYAGRYGFTLQKPTHINAPAPNWLAYADLAADGVGWQQALLNTPLIVTAGQTLWIVAIHTQGLVTGRSTGGVGATPGQLYYGFTFSTLLEGYSLSIQAAKSTTGWAKVFDFPAA